MDLFMSSNQDDLKRKLAKKKNAQSIFKSDPTIKNNPKIGVTRATQDNIKFFSLTKKETSNPSISSNATLESVIIPFRTGEDVTNRDSPIDPTAASHALADSEENIPKSEHSEDINSIDSNELAGWKRYVFWTELVTHYEDWPERLADTDLESEGSSSDSEDDQRTHQQIYKVQQQFQQKNDPTTK
jgi:hypothetical protein